MHSLTTKDSSDILLIFDATFINFKSQRVYFKKFMCNIFYQILKI